MRSCYYYSQPSKDIIMFLNTVEEDEVKKGYACYESICYEINCDYNNEYYLNTAQYGKAKNALVKCRKDKESGNNVYEMTHCDEFENNIYYENGSARNINEALISCTSNSCKTDSATSIGLPLCKLEMNGEIDDTKACTNNDNSLILNEGQHYLYYNEKGKIEIYKTDTNYQCKKVTSNSSADSITNIHIYDVTFKEIDYTKIRKSHYGATMYNCPYEKSCYQTYGYIVNNNNGFIRCSSEGCTYNNVTLLKQNCEEADIGSLVYNSGEIGICINKKESKSILKSKNKSFLLSIDINNSYPETFSGNEILININEGVSYITVDDSYILISNTNKIINNININSDNKLYQCNGNDRTCKLIDSPENGYYYSYLMNQSIIISCNNNCISTSNENGLIFTKDQYLYCEKYFPGNEEINVLTDNNNNTNSNAYDQKCNYNGIDGICMNENLCDTTTNVIISNLCPNLPNNVKCCVPKSIKTNSGLVQYAIKQKGKPYWYGTFGQIGTQSLYEQKKKQYPDYYTAKDFKDQIKQKVKVHDCVGLIKGYIWSETPDSTPTYNGSQDVSASGMYNISTEKGTSESFKKIIGQLVYKVKSNGVINHVGIYIGNNKVVEAKGHAYGVIESDYDNSWKYWSQCPYIKNDTTETNNTDSNSDNTKINVISTNGRCGSNYGKCPSNKCCSKKGYCGTSDSYCSKQKGCQSEYGKCKK